MSAREDSHPELWGPDADPLGRDAPIGPSPAHDHPGLWWQVGDTLDEAPGVRVLYEAKRIVEGDSGERLYIPTRDQILERGRRG